MMDSLLEYRNCPNCEQDDFIVLFDSNMGEIDFQKGIETVYTLPGGKYGRHVQCRNCRLIYVNPIEKAGKINEDYSKRKSDEDIIVQRSRLHATRSQVRLIQRYDSGTSLLDIGSGEGFFLFNASKAGYITKGIELCQDAAEYAKKEFGVDIEVGAFEGLQLPESCFDVVTLWTVLEHVPHPLTTLKKAHRILKPGGLLAISTPDIGSPLARILGKKWWEIRRLHVNQFTTKTLTEIVKNAGFKNVSSVCYRESISLLYLVIPILRYLKLYGKVKTSLQPKSILGRIMDKIIVVFPSKLNYSTVIAFK
jgi:2-polyprenyl-3-methyl-5-hydroxy-6-metoxy-1,4-benzoquinol methylase